MLERDTSQPVTSERAYSFSSAITHNLNVPHIITGSPANFDYNTIQDMRIADLNGDGKASYWVHLLIGIVAYINTLFSNLIQILLPIHNRFSGIAH